MPSGSETIPRPRERRSAVPIILEGVRRRPRRLVVQGAIDVVTFTSSSTVANFVTLIGEADLPQLLRAAVIACIGPITAETARSYGLTPTIVSDEYTIPALARAIVEYFRGT